MSDEPSKIDITDEMIAERRGGTGKMPADMPEWMANTITSIDKFSKRIGNVVLILLNLCKLNLRLQIPHRLKKLLF